MRGGGEEGGFWVLPASSPSPIVAVGCSCRLSRQFRSSGPDRGRWDARDPHSGHYISHSTLWKNKE